MSERFVVSRDGGELAGERWPGGSPVVVLLHQGVADRRAWRETASHLAPAVTVVSYDRRGFGESAPGHEPFSHVDDLIAVLGQVADDPVWLAGASAGGGVALDAAIVAPERIAGLVLIGSAVSGAPEPELDPGTQRLGTLLDQAIAAGDLDEVNRLETWLWLDGPAQPEGRVFGPARSLALDMNGAILRGGAPEDAGGSGVDAWSCLEEVRVPVTVACGDLDVPFLISQNRALAERLPRCRYQVLPGVAHLPNLEQPEMLARVVADAVNEGP
ncbi:MAG: alpha/beta hydrolase [Streptosporangiaceae bacterium]|nr:alpha/beta hydrolase [Streptosporangiaceae bacterium]MBV9856864.1 alpha/beta hydrolase [Streptosporangiaceae bacterium]